ncbi:DUF922 domain-containing protein [bacterium]|nr:DUF922 domain-containing protein [bacterium]
MVFVLSACTAAPVSNPQPAATVLPVSTNTSAPLPPTSTPTLTATPDSVEVTLSNAEVTYYEIIGSTEEELRAQMTDLGPEDPYDGNRHVDAYVEWYIYWNWDGYGTSDCDLSTAEVWYDLYLEMPSWTPPANASPELVTKWETFIRALKGHEAGHLDNIINNYQIVLTAIQSATCDTADAAATTALGTLRQFDANYDAETNHGATQGAIFP